MQDIAVPDSEEIGQDEMMRRKMDEGDLVYPYNHPADDIPRLIVDDLSFEMSHNPPEDQLGGSEEENEEHTADGKKTKELHTFYLQ